MGLPSRRALEERLPKLSGTYTVAEELWADEVDGHARHRLPNGMRVVDVTHPDNPAMVDDSLIAFNDAHRVYLARTYAYVAAGSQGLAIVDIWAAASDQVAKDLLDGIGVEVIEAVLDLLESLTLWPRRRRNRRVRASRC